MKSTASFMLISAATGLVVGAPSNLDAIKRDVNPYIQVHNNCGYKLIVGQSKNGDVYGTSVGVPSGGHHTFNLEPHWAGRVWGRRRCTGKDCNYAGLSNPASLAEVMFQDDAGDDYYDISLVDGYNEPMKLEPLQPDQLSESDFHHCGAPKCSVSPACPSELKLKDASGKVIGCQSACSKFRTDEYCCVGAYGSECNPSKYSQKFKDACPNAYSYAFDDSTSTFLCRSDGYKVTFCPK